jgi:hypothetical protein
MTPKKTQKRPVLVRFDRDLLAKIEKMATSRCISRNALIQYVLSSALDKIKI